MFCCQFGSRNGFYGTAEMVEQEVSLDGENEEKENSTDTERSASAMTGLNLALILLSLTQSDEEFMMSSEEIEKKEKERKVLDQKGKSYGSSTSGIVPSRRREVNEFRAVERQMGKANTKIRDCRHGRKM